MEKFAPLIPGNPCLIHGGDYNPDQWLGYPDILKEDVRLMKVAGVNSATVAIFAWAALEPREGEYHFEWLDEVFDRLWKNGIHIILSTPSGARPRLDGREVSRNQSGRRKNVSAISTEDARITA